MGTSARNTHAFWVVVERIPGASEQRLYAVVRCSQSFRCHPLVGYLVHSHSLLSLSLFMSSFLCISSVILGCYILWAVYCAVHVHFVSRHENSSKILHLPKISRKIDRNPENCDIVEQNKMCRIVIPQWFCNVLCIVYTLWVKSTDYWPDNGTLQHSWLSGTASQSRMRGSRGSWACNRCILTYVWVLFKKRLIIRYVLDMSLV